jgi:hypothetical protein
MQLFPEYAVGEMPLFTRQELTEISWMRISHAAFRREPRKCFYWLVSGAAPGGSPAAPFQSKVMKQLQGAWRRLGRTRTGS